MEEIKKDKILNIPNVLTLVRIVLLPVIAWRFRLGDRVGALVVYVLAMITDALDGIIARKTGQITALGKLLDPLADKLALILLLWLFWSEGEIPFWALLVILAKEAMLIIGSGAALRMGVVVAALPIGKVTTVSFIASMIVRFLNLKRLADILLYLSVMLALSALVWYIIAFMDKVKKVNLQK